MSGIEGRIKPGNKEGNSQAQQRKGELRARRLPWLWEPLQILVTVPEEAQQYLCLRFLLDTFHPPYKVTLFVLSR